MRNKRYILGAISLTAATLAGASVYSVLTAPPTVVHVSANDQAAAAPALPPAPPPVPEKIYIRPETTDVLVTTRPMQPGDRIAPSDIRWQAVLNDGVPSDAYVRQLAQDAEKKLVGSTVRLSLGKGDFLTPSRVVQVDSNYLAATLPAGRRAVAISLDPRGGRSAGGFIYPGDRVDVLVSRPVDPLKPSQAGAKTLLSGIKVLAIGQQLGDSGGAKVLSGDTATLEVTPAEAEKLAAETQGNGAHISLALRPMSEPSGSNAELEPTQPNGPITIVRFGVISENQ